MDHATMDTMRSFVSGATMLDVTPCEASFPAHGGQTLQMGVQNFGAQFEDFRAWNGPAVQMDNLFSGPGIELNLGEPLPEGPAATAPAAPQVAARKPGGFGLS